MKRKDFIRHSATGALLLAAGSMPFDLLAKGSNVTKLTILHTNDQHSRIEPFPMDGGKYQGLGGFAQRAQMINLIRAQEENVLLLDSGDIWQGTPYFNIYGGELEFKLMSQMKYDASTLGNHDFDAGLGGFVKQLPHATFPFLNSNYIFDNTPLQDKVQRYKLFQYGHVKIGVFGLGIELAGLVPTDLYGGIQYTDPVLAANKIAEQLKHDHKCDMVICLSHLGYKYSEKKVSDIILAETSKNIDLILGGHTHTFFDNPEEYKNAAGEKVLINQVGWAGIYLGRIDFYFEEKRKAALISGKPQLIS